MDAYKTISGNTRAFTVKIKAYVCWRLLKPEPGPFNAHHPHWYHSQNQDDSYAIPDKGEFMFSCRISPSFYQDASGLGESYCHHIHESMFNGPETECRIFHGSTKVAKRLQGDRAQEKVHHDTHQQLQVQAAHKDQGPSFLKGAVFRFGGKAFNGRCNYQYSGYQN
jgi:hypothetical protein